MSPLTAEPTAHVGINRRPDMRGKVYVVGAGPGDPDLLTVKALRCLRAADVIIYDRLIDPSLLDEARIDAERIYVGKDPGCHALAQTRINALLVEHARLGRSVVRLKGGDPLVFGRGGEEVLALAEAGIPFEIVPGVTSAVAVPAYAGIPVTHRGLASHFTVVTGHGGEGTTQPSPPPDWRALAKIGGTLIILMGVAALPSITQRLIEGGLERETPAAVIERGTTHAQRTVTGTLGTIADGAAAAGLTSPAITVIGAVAGLRDSLAWFEMALPLAQEE